MAEERVILITEDDESLINVYKIYFRLKKMANIVYASNVKECIDVLENRKPFIMFLDLGLEDLEPPPGFEILNNYKDKLKIVVISGYHQHRSRCLQEGAVDFLSKPADNEQMVDLIRKYSQ